MPADIRDRVAGQRIHLTVGGERTSILPQSHCSVSLRTTDAMVAKARTAEVEAQLQARWAAMRSGPKEPTDVELSALAGQLYRETIADHEGVQYRGTGSLTANDWTFMQSQMADAMRWFVAEGDDDEHCNPKQGEAEVKRLSRVEAFISERGLALTPTAERRFVELVGDALYRAYGLLARRAGGDNSLDGNEARFAKAGPTPPAIDLFALFDGWAGEVKPAARTIRRWRRSLERFIESVGHADAARLTPRDVAAWKDKLVAAGATPKTVNDSNLAALNRVLQWGVQSHVLEKNVAKDIKVARKRGSRRMGEFDLEEAVAIFSAAERETRPLLRWAPTIMALTGARVTEVCQLRGIDVRRRGDRWWMDITAAAGSVKNEGSNRSVPLHRHLVASGFVDFVQARGDGPLFYEPRNGGSPPTPGLAKDLSVWARRQVPTIGRKHRKDPSHAWRHTVITALRGAGVANHVIESIVGHEAGTTHGRYGTVPPHLLTQAIDTLPTPREAVRRAQDDASEG